MAYFHGYRLVDSNPSKQLTQIHGHQKLNILNILDRKLFLNHCIDMVYAMAVPSPQHWFLRLFQTILFLKPIFQVPIQKGDI